MALLPITKRPSIVPLLLIGNMTHAALRPPQGKSLVLCRRARVLWSRTEGIAPRQQGVHVGLILITVHTRLVIAAIIIVLLLTVELRQVSILVTPQAAMPAPAGPLLLLLIREQHSMQTRHLRVVRRRRLRLLGGQRLLHVVEAALPRHCHLVPQLGALGPLACQCIMRHTQLGLQRVRPGVGCGRSRLGGLSRLPRDAQLRLRACRLEAMAIAHLSAVAVANLGNLGVHAPDLRAVLVTRRDELKLERGKRLGLLRVRRFQRSHLLERRRRECPLLLCFERGLLRWVHGMSAGVADGALGLDASLRQRTVRHACLRAGMAGRRREQQRLYCAISHIFAVLHRTISRVFAVLHRAVDGILALLAHRASRHGLASCACSPQLFRCCPNRRHLVGGCRLERHRHLLLGLDSSGCALLVCTRGHRGHLCSHLCSHRFSCCSDLTVSQCDGRIARVDRCRALSLRQPQPIGHTLA